MRRSLSCRKLRGSLARPSVPARKKTESPAALIHARIEPLLGDVNGRIVPGPIADLASRRFLFVTGKGGVGKTTVSAAIASALASEGKRVLVAMCKTKERLSAVLGTPPIGPDVTPCIPNVWAVNIDPDQALHDYGAMVLKVRAVANAVFKNEYIGAFLRAVPGLHEWSMLGKAWFHTTEVDPQGRPRFDVVVFDGPATGHGLDMLRVPKIILEVAPAGVLRRDAQRAVDMFRDPARSGLVVVTLPEEMPVTETVELVRAVRDEVVMPILRLVVNGVLPPLFTEHERAQLTARAELLTLEAARGASTSTNAGAVAGARRALRESVQQESLRRLFASLADPAILLPFLFDEASTPEGTRILAELLAAKTVPGR